MHINQMICKANCIFGLNRHTCNDVKDSLIRKILDLAYVRPILEYRSWIWSPSAIRIILQSSARYEDPLKELNLSRLEDRRKF